MRGFCDEDEMGGHIASAEGISSADEILVAEPEGKKPLGIRRHRWENNIKIELKGMGCGNRLKWLNGAGEWTHEYRNETPGSINRGEFLDKVSDYEILKKNFTPRT
jgi:hypothetical protein